jgi:hypothetical protein
MSERWHIVDTYAQNRVLQVCHTERQAQRAQRKWNKLWLWHNGPKTTIRRVAVRDEN